jgi:hypothetical protein
VSIIVYWERGGGGRREGEEVGRAFKRQGYTGLIIGRDGL